MKSAWRGLQRQINYSRESVALDGIHPQEVLKQLSQQCHDGFDKQYRILNDILMPALEEENIRFLKRCEWDEGIAAWVKDYFHNPDSAGESAPWDWTRYTRSRAWPTKASTLLSLWTAKTPLAGK